MGHRGMRRPPNSFHDTYGAAVQCLGFSVLALPNTQIAQRGKTHRHTRMIRSIRPFIDSQRALGKILGLNKAPSLDADTGKLIKSTRHVWVLWTESLLRDRRGTP